VTQLLGALAAGVDWLIAETLLVCSVYDSTIVPISLVYPV